MEQREFVVEQETAGQRIDRFLSGEDTGLSRSALQALVADGHVLCNGRLVAKSLKLKAGDTIVLEIPDAKPIEAVPQDIPLEIVYEDEHLLVVNKPKGMVVHPAPGNPDGTLVNALLYHCAGQLSGIGVQRTCHRHLLPEAKLPRHLQKRLCPQLLPQPDKIAVAAFFQSRSHVHRSVRNTACAAEDLSIHHHSTGAFVLRQDALLQRCRSQHRLEH